ncbi:MAG: DUF2442 domain-containing protein [Candidatus Sumerlaeia bacterium]|nr:DUF2442 domain-containing protein [Candidatus Sumerlaeia bacterium]
MLRDIIAVEPRDDYGLHLRFEDGVEGTILLTDLVPFEGIFEPLRDPSRFRQVQVIPEVGTIGWPNGADLDPDVLYARLTDASIPNPFVANRST